MSDKWKTVLEHSVLFPKEPKPNIENVVQQFSRNSMISMVIVLTNDYCNKHPSHLVWFFSNGMEFMDIVRRISRNCNPNYDYIILLQQTILQIFRKTIALPAVESNHDTPEVEMQLFKVIADVNEYEMRTYNVPNEVVPMVFMQSLITYSSNVSKDLYKVRAELQTYSAFKFFEFIESEISTNETLRKIYEAFLQRFGIEQGIEYICSLWGMLAATDFRVGKMPKDLSNDLDKLITKSVLDAITLDYRCLVPDYATDDRENNVDYRAFRSRPIIHDEAGNYVIYWMEALIDRLYNSLYFDFLNICINLKIKYPIRQLFTDEFVEKRLFRDLMSRTYDPTLYKAKYNTKEKDNGKADYVLTRDNVTIIFECKDVKLVGEVLETHDWNKIMEEYRNKLYFETYRVNKNGEREYHDKPKPKGVGQLIKYLTQIREGDPYYLSASDNVVYPVLVLYDYKLLLRGFQQIADGWYAEREIKTENDKPLIVMSFITLIKSYPLFAKNGFAYYFEKYRNFISAISGSRDLRRYMTFDEYMQDYGESMDVAELRDEFVNAMIQHYKQKKALNI